jgi:hypothetical protein
MKHPGAIVAAVLLVGLALYSAGWVEFMRYHGCLVDTTTGEVVFGTPDTLIYRAIRVAYTPLLLVTHERIDPDKRNGP